MKNNLFSNTKEFNDFCLKIISGESTADTALDLMKSRYFAYTSQNIDYIMNTHDPDTLSEISKEVLTEWSIHSKWISLEILDCKKGEKNDSEGIVEFKAIYEVCGVTHTHHEKSLFLKKDNKWFYNSAMPVDLTVKNENKTERNDPCFCGSGKKYKKCCGK